MYALDEDRGLFVFDIKSPKSFVVRDFVVEIRRGKAFNFYE